jgi:peptidoglycan hydrolase-like protein with peptidoglycan-binding domain
MIVGSGPLAPSASSFFNYSSPGFQTVTPGATVVPPVATSIASTTAAAPYVFSKNHHQGDTGADILALQQFLNTHGFQVASSGPGSPGHESTFFGAKTYQALIKFQKANNLPATGYFGPLTRALINSQVR